jgi:hypothetical protein
MGKVVGMVGMMVGQIARGKGDRKLKLNGLRHYYLRYLGQVRVKVRRAAAQQRQAMEWSGPAPRSLQSLIIRERVWPRTPADSAFLNVRFATGTQALAIRLVPPETKPLEDLDPLCSGALRRFIRTHGHVPGLLRPVIPRPGGGFPSHERPLIPLSWRRNRRPSAYSWLDGNKDYAARFLPAVVCAGHRSIDTLSDGCFTWGADYGTISRHIA